jgi:hypothetical protein
MTDDHGGDDRPDYDPESPAAPLREPPLRSTAPQSSFTTGQVGIGVLVVLVGVVITFGLPAVL